MDLATAGRHHRVLRLRCVGLLVLAGVALILALAPVPALTGPPVAWDRSPELTAAVDHTDEVACPDGVLTEEDRDEEAKAGPGKHLLVAAAASSIPLAFRHGVSGALGPLVDHSCGHLGDGAPGATRAPPPAITGA